MRRQIPLELLGVRFKDKEIQVNPEKVVRVIE
jgi:hypothetical protein